jgi:signal transduction histidine kinase
MTAVSLSRKLTSMNMRVSGIALTVACVTFAVYDLMSLRDSLVRQLSIQAQITGANSVTSIEFETGDVAARNVAALEASPDVVSAEIYLPDGGRFARYARNASAETGRPFVLGPDEIERHEFTAQSLVLGRRIYSQGREIGTIYIHSSLRTLYQRLARYSILAGGVLMASMLMALLLTRSVQRSVSTPLVELADVASRVTRDEHYAERAVVRHDDTLELRRVVESFNAMMARIESRNRSLKEAHDELESRVQQRTIELQEINQELESFTYSVSHDLRAPLRHIAGFATMLEDRVGNTLDERSRKYLSTISAAAGRMGRLIDDLLAFSRMGRTSLSPRSVDLSRLVQEARSDLAPDTAGRQIEWVVNPLPTVHADPALLRPVLVNLLSNAMKYSAGRSPARIEIGAATQNGEAVVFVRDNGVGFDMRYVNKLFGVFQRLHRADEFEGTGIGLANVRRIIARHGGRTWAEGEVDRGATFYFSLPLARDAMDAGSDREWEEAGADRPALIN